MAKKRELMPTIKQTYYTSKKYTTDECEIRVHVDETSGEQHIAISTNDLKKFFVFETKLTRQSMRMWVKVARLIEEVANDHMPEKDDETPF